MNLTLIAMLISVQNALTGQAVASHTIEGWLNLNACQSQVANVKSQTSEMYGVKAIVTIKCIDTGTGLRSLQDGSLHRH